ncbi:hypothetical protein BDZ45DRAFT_751925 [Acephala macrosclerotiorum]|nr:hypothetical protein BDZ45DRAFT_751925 [Acephala macrosclerotiorum]
MSQFSYTRINGVDSGLELSPVLSETHREVDTQDQLRERFRDEEEDRANKDAKSLIQNGNYKDIQSESSSPRSREFPHGDYQRIDFENIDDHSSTLHRQNTSRFCNPERQFLLRNCCVPVLAVLAILFVGTFILFPGQHFTSPPQAKLQAPGICASTSKYKGWSAVNHTFAFGDSWTTTWFDYTDAQPSPSEPMGNPPFPGSTSSNATNWIGYLTTTYNSSLILTYNLAVAGTTLDNHVTDSYPVPVTEQVFNRFMPGYAEGFWTPWKSDDTLFIMFIGINDVMIMNPIAGPELISIDQRLFKTHMKLLNSLYGTGARNFLLMNVPPLERVWQPPSVPQAEKDKYGSDALMYNRRVEKVAGALKGEFDDANVWVFDTHRIVNEALDDPKRFWQTSGIKNTTEFCKKYELGTPTTDYFDSECGIRVDEYFWLNALHPTYPIHDLIAEKVAKMLEKGPNIC